MLKIPELAMPRSRKVTTVCNGKREVCTDYEEAKAYFLELMMTTEGEKYERAECIYIQLMHGLEECSDEDEYLVVFFHIYRSGICRIYTGVLLSPAVLRQILPRYLYFQFYTY